MFGIKLFYGAIQWCIGRNQTLTILNVIGRVTNKTVIPILLLTNAPYAHNIKNKAIYYSNCR